MADDEMTYQERGKYLRRMRARYVLAGRPGQTALLNEMEQVTGLHRKSLIRLMKGESSLDHRTRTRERGRSYGLETQAVVRVVWKALDYICAERLTPGLVTTARQLAHFGELTLSEQVEEKLGTISVSTVARMLEGASRPYARLPRKGPEEANRWRRGVPMGRLDWDIAEPGHCETDLVHHCGPVAQGDYLHTLQVVDIATSWSERTALLGRSQQAMGKAFERVFERMPFRLIVLHPDNGSEFFNNHLMRLLPEKVPGLTFARSRPYQKNDNRLVEQKNDSLVRAYLGHERLDTPEQLAAVNVLYDCLWVYNNLFQPVLHQIDKQVIDGKLIRHHDQAATPYQRLLATGSLTPAARTDLDNLLSQINPLKLREEICIRQANLWVGLPGAIVKLLPIPHSQPIRIPTPAWRPCPQTPEV